MVKLDSCLVSVACLCAALLACKGAAKGEITQPRLGTLTGSAENPSRDCD
jgi:hypothetical protein